MSTMVGNWRMAISDGCRPGDRLRLLNLSSANAHVEMTFCARGGRPVGPISLVIPPRRTLSPLLADLVDVRLPDLPYSAVVVSDAPVLVHPHQDAAEVRRPAA
ncbi:sensory rhodopsin transducer [Nonomuraea sp. NPDC050404]|uniref:sensory rhodopsin transducer n=1 Tax=Nonomuraea sp. NPDC050404 TaxID=3155783 RepID=UPI0034030202